VNVQFEFDNGEKHILVPANCLQKLRKEIHAFKNSEKLNEFQDWIVNDLYDFDLPKSDFAIESILLIAVPHPLYSHVKITHKGKQYSCLSLVSSDFEQTEKTLDEVSQNEGISFVEANNLPLKRLAVQSGFAKYGRNNITYVGGLGSNFSYMAFFTNIACEESKWVKANHPPICDKCTSCLRACPTGAIQKDRFLIDNQICLSYLNESSEPFPEWLSKSVHHTLYDCLKCQIACPMNKAQLENIGESIVFDENETQMLLSGTEYEMYPEAMKKKAKYLGLDQWPDGIAKNVETLLVGDAQRTKAN
jgi:epoxyqueuosine reductase